MIRKYDDATHVAVPIEPTEEMLSEWQKTFGTIQDAYRAMINAAPQSQEQSEPVAWMIKFKTPENPDWLNVHYHGTNAIADYRQIDPTATVTPLYTAQPDLVAKVAELERKVEFWRDRSKAQDTALAAQVEQIRVARWALNAVRNDPHPLSAWTRSEVGRALSQLGAPQ